MKKVVIIIVAVMTVIYIGYVGYVETKRITRFGEIPPEYVLKASKEKIKNVWEADWIERQEDGTYINHGRFKFYKYVSDVEVPTLEGEDTDKRTINSTTRIIGKTEKGEDIFESKIYSGTPLYRESNGKWYFQETAMTTIEDYDLQTSPPTSILFGWEATADSLVTQSEPGGDGWVAKQDSNVWNTTHDATTAQYYSDADTAEEVFRWGNDGTFYQLKRTLYPINTSALPDGAAISAATFVIYVTSRTIEINDGNDYIAAIQSYQASNTAIVADDYDNFYAIEGSDRIDMGSFTANNYATLTLDATGIGWISKTGWTNLGIREGHDIQDTGGAPYGHGNSAVARLSNYTGTTYDPTLTITYTIPAIPNDIPIIQIID